MRNPESVQIISTIVASELVVVIALIVAIASVFRSGDIWAALSAWVMG